MLLLNLKFGEYLTIGEDTYIQVFKHSESSFRAAIHAPKDVPIRRGAVRERTQDDAPAASSARRDGAKHYEAWAREKELRQTELRRESAERESAMRELSELAENMEELIAESGSRAVKARLNAVCERISALGFAPDANARREV